MAEMAKNMSNNNSKEEPVDLLDVLIVLAKYKVMILVMTIVAALLAAGIVMQSVNQYRSSAQILPASTISEVGLLGLLGLSSAKPRINDQLVLLQVEESLTELAKQFDLQSVYGQPDMEEVLALLNANITIKKRKGGIISLSVNDGDPRRAADMANALVEKFGVLVKAAFLAEYQEKLSSFSRQVEYIKKSSGENDSIYRLLHGLQGAASAANMADATFFQVVAKAEPAKSATKPKLGYIVAAAAILAFVISVLIALAREASGKVRLSKEQKEKIDTMRRNLSFK